MTDPAKIYELPKYDPIQQAIEISHLRRDLEDARNALKPLLMLVASVRESIGPIPPEQWPEKIRSLLRGERNAVRYEKLVTRLLSGEFEVRGVHFVMLEDDKPLPSDFDRELDADG